jgi:K+-transporting ATPase ATPase C chain
MFLKQLRGGIVALVGLTIVTGLLYPLVVTVIAQAVFPSQANGSILTVNGKEIGSALIGQPFSDPKYFWGRLSATSPIPYTAYNGQTQSGSTGSNFGPLNPALIGPNGTVQSAINAYHAADPDNTAPIPVDLVTASGSGLDPEISPAGAAYQVHRVAKARGLDDATVQKLVDQFTQDRVLGLLGEPRVNVLQLNLALDALPNQNPTPAATPAATQAATAAQ